MTDTILKYRTFFLFFGELSKRHFDLYPVWCEYYQPEELDDVDVSVEWIHTNLFNKLNSSDERAYYSTSEDIDYSKREFLNVICELVLDGHQLQGYLYVTQSKVNSISIFLGNTVVDLYSSELLSEDNIETINDISEYLKVNIENVNTIEYTLKNSLESTIVSNGKFHFSVE